MEWAADKAGLIPKNDEDAMAMRMVIGKTHMILVISNEPGLFDYENVTIEFSETIKEASVQAFGPAMKACEAAGTSFFGGKLQISVAGFTV